MPYRYYALKLRGNDFYRFLLSFSKITPPTEGKYGEAKFPDNLNILLDEKTYSELLKVKEEDEKKDLRN